MGVSSRPAHLNQNKRNKSYNIMMQESRVPMTMRDFFFDDPFFKSTWEDFDKVREKMFQESRDMWKKFDMDFRDMACMSNNIMVDSDIQEKKSTEVKSSEGRSFDRQNSLAKWENGWMFPGDGCCQVLAMSSGTWICSKRRTVRSSGGRMMRRRKTATRWSPDSSSGSTAYQLEPNQRMLFPISPLMEFLLSLQTNQTLPLMSRSTKSK